MDPQRLIEEKILNIENKILTCDLHPNDIDSLSILQNLQFVFGFNNLSFKSFGLAEFLLQLTNRLLVVPEISIKQKEAISTFCSELGWHFLINKGDFKYLLEFYLNAQRADSTNQDTRSMIPLCYVLNNMYPEAEKEYLNLKDIPWTNDEDYATFRDKFLDLIDDCEKLYGISHPDFEKVRELLLK